jgi:hypothetical protein
MARRRGNDPALGVGHLPAGTSVSLFFSRVHGQPEHQDEGTRKHENERPRGAEPAGRRSGPGASAAPAQRRLPDAMARPAPVRDRQRDRPDRLPAAHPGPDALARTRRRSGHGAGDLPDLRPAARRDPVGPVRPAADDDRLRHRRGRRRSPGPARPEPGGGARLPACGAHRRTPGRGRAVLRTARYTPPSTSWPPTRPPAPPP